MEANLENAFGISIVSYSFFSLNTGVGLDRLVNLVTKKHEYCKILHIRRKFKACCNTQVDNLFTHM